MKFCKPESVFPESMGRGVQSVQGRVSARLHFVNLVHTMPQINPSIEEGAHSLNRRGFLLHCLPSSFPLHPFHKCTPLLLKRCGKVPQRKPKQGTYTLKNSEAKGRKPGEFHSVLPSATWHPKAAGTRPPTASCELRVQVRVHLIMAPSNSRTSLVSEVLGQLENK